MIEAHEDQCGGSQTTIHGSELASWESLCMSLRIEDAWHHPGYAQGSRSFRFSHSDRWAGVTNLSWIDRMCISDDLGARGGTIEILAEMCIFDYSVVMLVAHEHARSIFLSLRIPESI